MTLLCNPQSYTTPCIHPLKERVNFINFQKDTTLTPQKTIWKELIAFALSSLKKKHKENI